MIQIVAYDAGWPVRFSAEAERLRNGLGPVALRIEHVGSTSVPGLAAKPVVDIQISVPALEPRAPLLAAFETLGYTHVFLGDFDRVYPFFKKPADWPSTYHVHVCEAGSVEEWRHLAFRDYLRRHRSACDEYVRLKRELAALHGGATQETREQYSLGKTGFVEACLKRASLGEGAQAAMR